MRGDACGGDGAFWKVVGWDSMDENGKGVDLLFNSLSTDFMQDKC